MANFLILDELGLDHFIRFAIEADEYNGIQKYQSKNQNKESNKLGNSRFMEIIKLEMKLRFLNRKEKEKEITWIVELEKSR